MSNLEIVFTLCIPILIIILGIGLKAKTPKKNSWIGWRTPTAMKSENVFKKANIYAGKIMFKCGILYKQIGSFITPWVCMAQIIVCALMIGKIEKKIKEF